MKREDNRIISVLIVSDSHLIRSGLRRILDSEVRIRVLGDMSVEKATALDSTKGKLPDVLLIELDSRGSDALKFLGGLTNWKKDSAVLVLSDLVDHDLAQKALALGATGIVLKVQPPAVLIAALLDLCHGYIYEPLSTVIATEQSHVHKLFNANSVDPQVAKKIDSLTVREREIIRLVSLGLRNKDIAHQLSISDITVRHHLSSIFCKLEVSDRQKLLILAHSNGLAELAFRSEPA
jgi:DNA-binding NarL/FixJ family response regulator